MRKNFVKSKEKDSKFIKDFESFCIYIHKKLKDMKTAVLITRTVDCSKLTKEQFVNMMSEDLTNALHEDVRIFKPIAEAQFYHNQEQHLEYVEKRAREFAAKKWKTDKRRDQYVLDVLSKEKRNVFEFRPVSFFDFDVEPGKNGISGYCVLHPCETKEKLEQCFEYIKDNEYFKAAKGWQLVDKRNSRPEIQLILDEEMEAKYHNAEKGLSEAISNFYKNTNYWGD